MAQAPGEQTPTNGPAVRREGSDDGLRARPIETAARPPRSFAQDTPAAAGEAVEAGFKTAETTLQGLAETMRRTLGVGDERNAGLAERAAENVRTVSEATSALTRGAQEAAQAWIELAQDEVRAQVQAASRLADCRSAPDVIALQCELWRERVQRNVEASQAIARTSLSAIEDARRRIEPSLS